MKTTRQISSAHVFCLISELACPLVLLVFTAVHVWAQEGTIPNIKSNALNGSRSLPVTFSEPPARTIQVYGTEYDLPQALAGLFQTLDSTNGESKSKWLHAVTAFRTDLNTNVVSTLIQKLKTEPDPKVRFAILATISVSQDPRYPQVCISARNDPDPYMRLFAGAALIEQNELDGVELLTRCLAELDDSRKEMAMLYLIKAIHQFKLDYHGWEIADTPLAERKRLNAFVPNWTKWWNENKKQYLDRKR